jgi:hypothetical protein
MHLSNVAITEMGQYLIVVGGCRALLRDPDCIRFSSLEVLYWWAEPRGGIQVSAAVQLHS